MEEIVLVTPERSAQLLALDEALHELTALDARKARLVELRFFAGLTIAETAEVLGVATVTVVREWRLARAWLRRRIAAEPRLLPAGAGRAPRLP